MGCVHILCAVCSALVAGLCEAAADHHYHVGAHRLPIRSTILDEVRSGEPEARRRPHAARFSRIAAREAARQPSSFFQKGEALHKSLGSVVGDVMNATMTWAKGAEEQMQRAWAASRDIGDGSGGGGGGSGAAEKTVLERIKAQPFEVIAGLAALVLSLPILWASERRSSQFEELLWRAKRQARTVGAERVDPKNHSWLVHVPGARLRAAEPVQDSRFDVEFKQGVICLQTTVEVFQIVQDEFKTESQSFGAKETTTVLEYRQAWSPFFHESAAYIDPKMDVNWKPEGLEPGVDITTCYRTLVGDAFVLPEEFVRLCGSFEPAADKVSTSEVRTADGQLAFKRAKGEEWFYFRRSDMEPEQPEATLQPQVGDCRVRFQIVPDGAEVTAMALQEQVPGESLATFLPFRLIGQGLCGLSEEEEKEALRRDALKSPEQLREEAGCPCLCACLCCACSCCSKCCAGLLAPQVHGLWKGTLTVDQCLAGVGSVSCCLRWYGRLIGWLVLLLGFLCIFGPIEPALASMPALAPVAARLGGGFVWLLCGVATLTFGILTVAVAYLYYHPLLAILIALVAVLVPAALVVAGVQANK